MSINIKRRKIIKAGGASLLLGSVSTILLNSNNAEKLNNVNYEASSKQKKSPIASINSENREHESAVQDNLQKVKNFNQTFTDDLFLTKEKNITFQKTLKKILNVQKVIGYANFNLIGFDDMILYSRRFPDCTSLY